MSAIRLSLMMWAGFSLAIAAPTVIASAEEEILEEVVVTGKRPGPPLWKVSHGEHVLWIFGTLQPLPRSLQWDQESLRWIMDQAATYITPPALSASTSNPFKAMSVMRQIGRLKKLPDEQTLEAVLPPPLWARFDQVRSKYAPRNRKLERLRPSYAADALFEAALRKVSLTDEIDLAAQLRKMARKADLEIVAINEELALDAAIELLKEYTVAAEVQCLRTTLDAIETDLQAAAQRALAWADGDSSLLRKLDYPATDLVCDDALYTTEQAQSARLRGRNAWLDAAEHAVRSQAVSVSSLPVHELITEAGLLAELRARLNE